MIIATPYFSEYSAFKMFSSLTKTNSRRFLTRLRLEIAPAAAVWTLPKRKWGILEKHNGNDNGNVASQKV